MIAIAQHPRRSVFGAGRSVFLLIVLTAALAFGLMAMHALNTPTTCRRRCRTGRFRRLKSERLRAV